MVTIRSITVTPPLINTACAWASDEAQLAALLDCPHTGAVTTRTVTLDGFEEDASHTVAFLTDSLSSINTYGYSPHPLARYLGWLHTLLERTPASLKPFLISITASSAPDLRCMLAAIQGLRGAHPGWAARIAVELNASCPNVPTRPPPAYDPAGPVLGPLLEVLAEVVANDASLTAGIKLPPYVVPTQIAGVVRAIGACSRVDGAGARTNPIAFITCTNTLGNCLVFEDQVEGRVPPGVGGLAGDAIHALSLGNVHAFSKLLVASGDPALQQIVVIGAGGVTSPEAVARMHRAGAKVVGCATLLGRLGVAAFEKLSKPVDSAP